MKQFASLALVAALAAGLGSVASVAHAAAPQVKTQAPGYYRMMLGDFEITALNDGTVMLPVDKLLHEQHAGQVADALKKAYLGTPLETSVNGFLVNTGSKLVLIDTGTGAPNNPGLGRLRANLQAAGYQPEQVDEVYITHLHGDHVGGLLVDGKPAFPNATVRMDKAEADHWLSEAGMAAAPEARKGTFKTAMAALKPYQDAGRFKTFEGSVELVPGIRAVGTHGHTPGHAVYVVESKGQKLVAWGDLMHVAAVQFADPSVTISFDSDSAQARPQREKAYAEAAAQGYYVAVAHISFPGIGRLRAEGKGYTWLPVNYSAKP